VGKGNRRLKEQNNRRKYPCQRKRRQRVGDPMRKGKCLKKKGARSQYRLERKAMYSVSIYFSTVRMEKSRNGPASQESPRENVQDKKKKCESEKGKAKAKRGPSLLDHIKRSSYLGGLNGPLKYSAKRGRGDKSGGRERARTAHHRNGHLKPSFGKAGWKTHWEGDSSKGSERKGPISQTETGTSSPSRGKAIESKGPKGHNRNNV